MVRARAFQQVKGFDVSLIAGEEPELCVRLRREGFRIVRIAAEMTTHDAAMTRFSQWWKRARRAGHAYAEGAALHGREPERHWVHQSRSAVFWGVAVPLLALTAAWPTRFVSFLLLLGYPALFLRIHARERARLGFADAALYAFFCVLAKFPEGLGALSHLVRRFTGGGRALLIEYKSTDDPATGVRHRT
jgi:GT2 family glycosyltransferase